MKRCSRCGEAKPPTDGFYVDGKNGRRDTTCKECRKAAARANRERRIDYYRDYDRHRYYTGGHRGEASEEAKQRRARKWLAANGHKRRAHCAVNNAVRDGRLEKPDHCERCKSVGPVQAHHHDYDKPLDVVWVCTACHGLEHRSDDWGRLITKPNPEDYPSP